MSKYVTFTGSGMISGIRTNVGGFSIGSSGAAVVNIRDGITASDPIVLRYEVGAADSQTVGGLNVSFDTGVYVEVVSGTVVGSIWHD